MKNEKDLIIISRYGRTLNDLTILREDLRKKLGESLFHITDFQTLQYEALSKFSLVKRQLINTEDSINKAAKKVSKHFLRNIKVKVKHLSGTTDKLINSESDNPLKFFNEFILGFDKTPQNELIYLKENVEFHLKKINELICWYETNNIIIAFKRNFKAPSNHEERIWIDFYKRCLNERDKILNHFFNGLKSRAIQRANAKLGLDWAFAFEWYHDFPYKSARIYSDEYFDTRKISEVYHRIMEVDSIYEDYATSLYKKDKGLFYKELFTKKPVVEYLKSIDWYAQHLPFKHERSLIFSELKKLLKKRQWVAFYALALPQVEGIFTEMLHAANPDIKGKSLTEKVEQVRPLYFASESYFDYYQYIVPKLRNEFLHTGFGDNFKLKSYDLLTDLEHILKVFYELDNPNVKVTRIIKQQKRDDFLVYADFAKFFELVGEMHNKQKKQLQKKLEEFVSNFLLKEADIEILVQAATEDISTLQSELSILIEKATNSVDLADAITILKESNLEEAITKYSEELDIAIKSNPEKWEQLKHLNDFANCIKHYFKNWNHPLKDTFLKEMKQSQFAIHNFLKLKDYFYRS